MSVLVKNENELDDCLRKNKKLAVLFYVSWCHFSREFLPIFERSAKNQGRKYRRVLIDDLGGLADKYGIKFHPTVIFFEGGKVAKRLDGIDGIGINRKQLAEFIAACGLK